MAFLLKFCSLSWCGGPPALQDRLSSQGTHQSGPATSPAHWQPGGVWAAAAALLHSLLSSAADKVIHFHPSHWQQLTEEQTLKCWLLTIPVVSYGFCIVVVRFEHFCQTSVFAFTEHLHRLKSRSIVCSKKAKIIYMLNADPGGNIACNSKTKEKYVVTMRWCLSWPNLHVRKISQQIFQNAKMLPGLTGAQGSDFVWIKYTSGAGGVDIVSPKLHLLLPSTEQRGFLPWSKFSSGCD